MRRLLVAVFCLPLFIFVTHAQSASHVATPPNIASTLYSNPSTKILGTSAPQIVRSGPVVLGIKLQDPPLVIAVGANGKQNGTPMTADQQRAYVAQLNQKQSAIMSQLASMGGVEIARLSKGHNALVVSIDASHIAAIQGISGVAAVRPVSDYSVAAATTSDLPTTDAFVGASSVQASGITGQGIRVALLDTGIDYTHYNLGGSGNVADYMAAAATASGTPPANLFPTTKVIGGYDFVGDTWNGGTVTILTPDANPIDLNGHGTLTADILGGHSLDGVHNGTAPGTQLYAVKVCSSISSSCSGAAMLKGIEFALDPNNTGTLSDAVDVMNISVAGPFGMREDDVSEMLTDVVNFGVVAVTAAGDYGDIPYVMGHPAATPEVISVGATTAVNAFGIPLVVNSPPSIAGTYSDTATLSFAPIGSTVTGNVAYVGRGCPASGSNPADAYLANPSGKIALIDRGTCAISLKIDRAASAGAIGVLIGLVAPGDAVSFSNGGGSNFVPSLVITQATSNLIQSALASTAVNVTFSSNNSISLASNVASYTSRGPNYSYNMLKPDISAPGTITAAQVGTGNGQFEQSGTSFASPLVAGSAALLLSKNSGFGPLDVKALLMETSEVNLFENSATQPGVLAPMSRMGAGELRVNRTAASTTSVWDASNPLGVSISFGTYRLNTAQSFKKKIIVRNYSSTTRTYTISNTYRDAPNVTGATLSFPPSVSVAANSSANFTLALVVNPASLPVWTLNGGTQGGNGELLNTVEYAGYLTLIGGSSDTVHIPWHILPHKAANVMPASTSLALSGNPQSLTFTNTNGAIGGAVDVFSLTGTGTQFPASVLPAPGSDYAVINLQAVGVRLVCLSGSCSLTSGAYGVQFAITTFGQRSHPDVPAEFDVMIDANQDGTPDFIVFNEDIGLASPEAYSGQNGVFVEDLSDGNVSGPYFYSIADLDSANVILTAPLSSFVNSQGLTLTSSTPFTFSVEAFDNFYTGNLTDSIGPMIYELDMPVLYPAQTTFTIPANSSQPIMIFPNNAANPFLTGPYNGNSPSQTGLLFMYTDGKAAREFDSVNMTP